MARITKTPLLDVLINRLGLEASAIGPGKPANTRKIKRLLTSDKVLQLFSEDTRANQNQLLISLISDTPETIELLLSALSREQKRSVLLLFGRQPPALSTQAAAKYAMLLARSNEPASIRAVLPGILQNSGMKAIGAALASLYQENCLDYGLLLNLIQSLTTEDKHPEPLAATILRSTRQQQNHAMHKHIQVFYSLIFQALPDYQNYWAQCTGLPAEDCPVQTDSLSLQSSLMHLSQQVVEQLCSAQSHEDLVNFTSQHSWRKIQPKASATLKNPDPATGDFIFRAFASLLPQKVA
ncbi:hypothetical protein PAHA111176_03445 [Parendozoicomonas haliclonae]|uniref:Uncharacterized protein n=2 Tax=Parendozoicomonas haliclonae TaxID=1960125 RepID=A0A1X7AJ08_9GAMM|nr:hypothetical protein EHSB41UT_02052 [Parendozoicomonas haliclonae]